METKFLGDHVTVPYTNSSGGTQQPGQPVQTSGGQAGILAGSKALANGEQGAAIIAGRVQVNKLTTDAIADGENVQWDDGNNEAVNNANVAGDFSIGKAFGAVINGDTTVTVLLNA